MTIERDGEIAESTADGLQVGLGGRGAIRVSDGSVLVPDAGIASFLDIGADPGGDGLLSIVDPESRVEGFTDLNVGTGSAVGVVEVSDGGWLQLGALDADGSARLFAGRGAGSDGRIEIDRGLVTLQGAEFGDDGSARPYAAIGHDGATGELSITGDAGSNHGLVMAGGADSPFVTLDIGFNGVGSATLEGGLLSLENLGRLGATNTGAGGQANIRVGVENGDGNLTANAGAEIRVETGFGNGAGFNVGSNSGTGQAILDNSDLTVSSEGWGAFLTAGTDGGDGALRLQNGAQAHLDSGGLVGAIFLVGSEGQGEAVLTGPGTRLDGRGFDGQILVGDSDGRGSLTLENGAQAQFEAEGDFSVQIGSRGGEGATVLTGPGTRLDGSGFDGRVAVGDLDGTGSLTVENGAEMEIETVGFQGLWIGNRGGTGTFELTDGARYVARSTGDGEFENSYMLVGTQGGSGSALIDDAELVLESASPFAGLRVATAFSATANTTGTGDLTIQNGAQVRIQATESSDFWIGGDSGDGTATIRSGAEVDLGGNGLLHVGRAREERPSDGSGRLSLSGEDTRVTGVETAEIGRFGATGTLEVAQGALLSVTAGLIGGDAELGGTPRIFLDGGTIEAEDMLLYGGVLAGAGLLRDIGAAEGFVDLRDTALRIGDLADSAGALTTGIGELRIEGDMTQSGGRADFDFDAQGGDQLIVAGALTFEGTSIALNRQGAGTPETEILLARADGGITLADERVEISGFGGTAELQLRADQTELWAVIEDTNPISDGQVGGTVSGRDGAPLEGVTVSLTDGTETAMSMETDASGAFVFDMEPGVEGRIELARDYTDDDPAITARDALDVLRLAVGLAPSWGTAEAHDFIAADINRDGQVTSQDALEVLRSAVGLETSSPPGWVFVDDEADLTDINRTNVTFEEGKDLVSVGPEAYLGFTGILLGSMQEFA